MKVKILWSLKGMRTILTFIVTTNRKKAIEANFKGMVES